MPEDGSNCRIDGCKVTLISAGIHMQQTRGLGDSTADIRHQGGWRGRSQHQTMPDTYLRESRALSLD